MLHDPLGGANNVALPRPGGVLRVEQTRETMRPVRIAQDREAAIIIGEFQEICGG